MKKSVDKGEIVWYIIDCHMKKSGDKEENVL